MPRYYVTGGRQKASRFLRRDEWHAYGAAVVVELDTDTGQAETILEYTSPPGRRPAEDPSHVFKAGAWDGEHLLLCTQTEVVVFDPRGRRVVRTLSHPWMNDVHHVARVRGRLHVVSTGLDALLVLDDDGTLLDLVSATGREPWERFDRGTDYRVVPTTKPHQCHPNYVFEADGTRWLTRFEQRDAIRLDLPGPSIRVHDEPIHDGIVHGASVWFTVVAGYVVEADPVTGEVRATHDLDRIGEERGLPLGWCRGMHIDGEVTLLGFSRLRPTKIKQNLSWLRGPLDRPEAAPTRVAAYDLRAGRKLCTWIIEDVGISSIFSILPVTPAAAHP